MSTDIAPAGDSGEKQDDSMAMFDIDIGALRNNAPLPAEAVADEIDSLTDEMSDTGPSRSESKEQGSDDGSTGQRAPSSGDVNPPDHDAVLRQRAASLGYSTEDVQSFDRDTLEQLVELQAELTVNRGAAAANAALHGAHQAPQQPAPAGQQPQVPVTFEPFKVELDPAIYDPAIIDHFAKMSEHYAQQTRALAASYANVEHQARVQAMHAQQAMVQQRDAMESRELDRWIDKQGDAFAPVFGGKEITADSPAFRVRAELFNESQRLQQQAAAAGVPLDPDMAREMAAKRVLGNSRYEYFKQQSQRQPIEKRQQQMTQRANGSAAAPRRKTGYDAAAERLDKFAEKFL